MAATAGQYTPKRGPFANETFPSYRQYLNAKGAYQRTGVKPLITIRALGGLSARQERARIGAFTVVGYARREGVSIAQARQQLASRDVNPIRVSQRTINKYAGTAIAKEGNSYIPKHSDSLVRGMAVITEDGAVRVNLDNSRDASLNGRYLNAIKEYLKTGDGSVLQPFVDKSITINGQKHTFITDLDVLNDLADTGQLQFDDVGSGQIVR